jgi:hypothetical protein
MFFLVGCNQPDVVLPTLAATAVAPTITPTPSPIPPTPTSILPPTRDLSEIVPPTAAPEDRPTRPPATPVPTPTPTPLVPAIAFSNIADGAELIMGSQLSLSGMVRRAADQRVILTLVTATNHSLIELEDGTGASQWEANFRVPDSSSGPAKLSIYLVSPDDEILVSRALDVQLKLDTSASDRYLDLYRPVAGDTAVAGYSFFFDGYAQLPVGNTITLSIWHQECRVRAARQSYVLRGSGYWHGFIVVPNDLEGEVCAVASFGSPEGSPENWREAQLPMTILPAGRETPPQVAIAIPAPGSQLRAGQRYIAHGTAANARNADIVVSIWLDNGRIVLETTAVSDYWGFWETSFTLPDEAQGAAQIFATLGVPSDANFTQTYNPITITPP